MDSTSLQGSVLEASDVLVPVISKIGGDKLRILSGQFEIGNIYTNKNKQFFYLAVESDLALGFRKGKLVQVTYKRAASCKFKMVVNVSVADLMDKWGVSLEFLDQISAKYLSIPYEKLKTNQGSGRPRTPAAEKDLAWRKVRLVTFSKVS